MVKIIKRETVRTFYENAIAENISSKEGLAEPTTQEFKNVLKKYSQGNALDLGYCFGKYSMEAAKKGLNVWAIDFISPKHLKSKVRNKKYGKNIHIIKKDINSYNISQKYSIIIAKDTLHFLPKKKLLQVIKKISENTSPKGSNYLVLFTNIKRNFLDGKKIIIENEAEISRTEFVRFIKKIYKNKSWKLAIKTAKHKEEMHEGLEMPFKFCADKVTVIAEKEENTRLEK